MKYIKKFESNDDMDEKVGILTDLIKENPNHKTHDFYIFLARDDFKEAKDGLYKKTIEIENMVRITPDAHSVGSIQGMEMRARFSPESTLYHIWLPKEIRSEVEYNGSNSMEDWLVDLINKHKMRGGDEYGKKVYKDVLNRREEDKKTAITASKFNL